MWKKIICAILVLSMMISCTLIVSATDVDDLDNIRNRMIAYGMPEKIVNSLPDSEVLKYANIASNSVEKHYYELEENTSELQSINSDSLSDSRVSCVVTEITEEECMAALNQNAVQPRGEIKKSYMAVTIDAVPIEGRRYLISATYDWLSTPIFKIKDYFALTVHDSMVLIPDTVYTLEQNDYVSIYSGSTIKTNSWEDSLYSSGIGGHCMIMHWMPDDDYTTYFNFRGYMSFEAEVAEVGPTGVVNSAAYITYAHKTLLPAIGFSVSLPLSASASISPAYAFDFFYDMKNFTHEE